MKTENLSSYAPVILRIGVCLVYLWFGISQLTNPAMWTSYIPDYAIRLAPLSAEQLVLANGIAEVILAALILLGYRVRIFAALLALHALHILVTVGYSAIGVRDFGIFVAVLSVFLYGPDRWSLDNRKKHMEVGI